MQRIITLVVVVAVVLIAGFFYFTRPVSAPTQAVDTVAEKLVPVTKTEEASTPVVEQKVYRISQSQSSVQFSIGEILNGAPFTAVGKTSEVAGDIAVTQNQITVGEVVVNAKTFKTDSSRRDGAIVRFILKSDQPANEFITFKPTAPIAFTAPIVEGKEISTKIPGDLTVSGVTKPATFAVKIKTQAGKLLVTGGTTVKRSDFDLKIPELSFIASVDDKVMISVSAVAEMVK